MNPKQFLAFAVVAIFGFLHVVNGGGGDAPPPHLYTQDMHHGAAQSLNLPSMQSSEPTLHGEAAPSLEPLASSTHSARSNSSPSLQTRSQSAPSTFFKSMSKELESKDPQNPMKHPGTVAQQPSDSATFVPSAPMSASSEPIAPSSSASTEPTAPPERLTSATLLESHQPNQAHTTTFNIPETGGSAEGQNSLMAPQTSPSAHLAPTILSEFGAHADHRALAPTEPASPRSEHLTSSTSAEPSPSSSSVPDIEIGASTGDENECPICLQSLVGRERVNQLHCRHRFHASCIDGWRQVRDVENHIPDCPICREPLPPSFWQRTIRALHRLGGFLYNALHLREMQVHIGVERQNDGHNQNWQWRFYPSAADPRLRHNFEAQFTFDARIQRSQFEIEHELRAAQQYVQREIYIIEREVHQTSAEMQHAAMEAGRSAHHVAMEAHRAAMEASRSVHRGAMDIHRAVMDAHRTAMEASREALHGVRDDFDYAPDGRESWGRGPYRQNERRYGPTFGSNFGPRPADRERGSR